MRKVALRGLFARKLRLVLTALAVALGVTLIAGTYVFTDTINSSFDKIFTESAKGTDASITPRKTIDTSNNGGTQPTVSPAILAQVRRQPGVQSADGSVFDVGDRARQEGRSHRRRRRPELHRLDRRPAALQRVHGSSRGASPARPTRSRSTPRRPKRKDLSSATGSPSWPPRRARTTRSSASRRSPASTPSAARRSSTCSLPEAQRMLGKRGFDQIQVSAKNGVSPAQLRDQLRTALPQTVNVRTGQEQARKQSNDIKDNLGFLTTALLAFAGISLFVGAFIIFNTFSITVAQRMREFALLRTLGASRGQVLRSVITEGLTIGVLGSLVGLLLGLAVAERPAGAVPGRRRRPAVRRQRDRDAHDHRLARRRHGGHASCPRSPRRSAPPACRRSRRCARARCRRRRGRRGWSRSPASLLGARRHRAHGRRPVRHAVGERRAELRRRRRGGDVPRRGAASARTSSGRSPSVVGRPFERFAASPAAWRGRTPCASPGRTAVTAAALMVGVALVTFVSIFAAGAKTTIAKAVDDNLKAAVRRPEHRRLLAVLAAVRRRVAAGRRRRARRARCRFAQAPGARGQGQPGRLAASTRRRSPTLYDVDGSRAAAPLRALGPGRIAIVSKKCAEDHKRQGRRHAAPDDRRSGARVALKVTGIVDDKGGLVGDAHRPQPACVTRLRRAQGRLRLRRRRGPARTRSRPGRHQARCSTASSPRPRSLTNEGVQGRRRGPGRPAAVADLRAARAGGDRVAVRDRQHARALDQRAHARARHAARDRHVAPPGPSGSIRYEAVITALIGGVLGIVARGRAGGAVHAAARTTSR